MRSSKISKYGKSRLNEGLTVCSNFWRVSKEDILGSSRKRQIINARHSLRYYLCLSNDLSLAEIGALTDSDHSSVIHSRAVFECHCEYEEDFRAIKRIMKGDVAHKKEISIRRSIRNILSSGESLTRKTNLILEVYENK